MNTVICANLTIREKLNMLRTLVDISDIRPDKKKEHKAILRKIGTYEGRNMVVHNYFLTGATKPGIAFLTVRAKGNFSTPAVPWGEEEFYAEYAKIKQFKDQAMQIAIALEHATFSADDLLVPMKLVDSSGRRDRRAQHSPTEPDSHRANPETRPETPDETQE